MEKKQSSVELFAIALYEKGFLKGNGNEINDLLEQAKAMHKEEVQESYREGRSDQQSPRNVHFYHRNAESYYNETFGGNNE